MYAYNIAYRHANGEVEGFVGCGSTKEAALMNAIARIKAKCEAIRVAYDPTGRIDSFDGLTDDEIKLIANDWRLGF